MMSTEKKETKKHLAVALREIGKITPWFDKEVNAWVFSHPKYPVEYAGNSSKEVIKNYPKYLKMFIIERLNDNLSELTEKATKGKGGKREGAGRPKGTKKVRKKRIYVPEDIADILQRPEVHSTVREMMVAKGWHH
ncbi:MAG TPA: hypothetical protein VLG76_04180 [Rhabdochlamydiaceae bacterium]|nr:hypothetical protein [Rhabdochlamydiaceae bacterium]